MQGASRSAYIDVRTALAAQLSNAPGAVSELAQELFAAVDVIDANAVLRRSLADPTGEAVRKSKLVDTVFGAKVSPAALAVITAAATARWSTERDLSDVLEETAVETMTVAAEQSGRDEQTENDLFRFERLIAGSPELTSAVRDQHRSSADRAKLVQTLLSGKTSPETSALAQRAASHPRGRSYAATISAFLTVMARRRGQSQAVAYVALPPTDEQMERLTAALTKLYGKPVQVNVVIDPQVVGGIRVLVGDEVIDGTIMRRLETARAHLIR